MKLFALLIGVLTLSACAGLNPANYSQISTQITQNKIDFKTIALFARRAEAAYLNENEIRKRFPKTTRISTPEGTDVQYFLEIIPDMKMQVISIRGSANLKNVIEDAETKKILDNKLGIVVHKGFHDIALKIYKDIRPHLKKNYRVAATGHSLGAASSIILLMYLVNDGFIIAPSVNFGQPKVTNGAGVKRYSSLPVIRVVDSNDVISLFPPSIISKTIGKIYQHIGAEIILLKTSHYVFLDKHAANRLSVGELWRNIGRAVLDDHSIRKYMGKIRDLESRATQVSYADRVKFEN